MNNDYIEAILIWSEKGPSTDVGAWFTKRGLKVVPMRQGLLISGGVSVFKEAFQVDDLLPEKPIVLPIPEELSEYVMGISIPKPRRF